MTAIKSELRSLRTAALQAKTRAIVTVLWDELLPAFWKEHATEAPPTLPNQRIRGALRAIEATHLTESSKAEAVKSVEAAKARVADIITGEQQAIKHLKAEWRQAIGLLRFSEFRNLTRPEIVQAICEAMTDNNMAFFKALGKALEPQPQPISSRLAMSNISKFTLFLILNWANFDVLPVCLLRISDLLEVSRFCGLEPLDEVATRKMIERFGLQRPVRLSPLRIEKRHDRLFVVIRPAR